MLNKNLQKNKYSTTAFYKVRFIKQFYFINIILFICIILGPRLNITKEILGLLALLYFVAVYFIYGQSEWSKKEWYEYKITKAKGSLLEILAGIISGQVMMLIFSFVDIFFLLSKWIGYASFVLLPITASVIFFGLNEYYKENKKIKKEMLEQDYKDFKFNK